MKNYLVKENKQKKIKHKKKKKERQNFPGCWRACFSKLQAPPCRRGGRKEVPTTTTHQ
jgi:hypothetical protein